MAETWDHLEEWEEWDPSSGTSFHVHAFAGSLAGAAEHCAIFPMDTIKTHMQTEGLGTNSVKSLVQKEGVFRLWRGVSSMFAACIPAHAAYFSLFEQSKIYFGADQEDHTPLAAAACGAVATIAHDSIMTPMDVIKQRLQLGFHTGILDCARSVIRAEGAGALFISFPTTLLMNIPYAGVMVAANESFKKVLNPGNEYNLPAFFASGGMAGAVAAAFTTPLDVVKTRLQTQSVMSSMKQVGGGSSSGSSPKPAKSSSLGGRGLGSGLQFSSPFFFGGKPSNNMRSPLAGLSASPFYSRACRIKYTFAKGTTTFTNNNRTHFTTTTVANKPIRYHGILDAVRIIYKEEGWRGFTRGLRPRVFVNAPSVAISWTTYETAKNALSNL